MQRLLDISFSLIAIVLLAPVFLISMFILKVTGEREIFYFQERIGHQNKEFNLFKFATMKKNSETMGAGTITMKDDPRVLPFGKILRKTKINELPQIFNIFKGDMSFIGPRPLHKKQFSFYSREDQIKIASVRPGLSGVSSILFRDEEEILGSYQGEDPDEIYKKYITPKKSRYEIWYIENSNIFLYFKLIFLTIFAVFNLKINYKDIIGKGLNE